MLRTALVLLLAMSISCGSYSKTCSGGLCKTVKDGKVTYTGDPEKVAEAYARDEARAEVHEKIREDFDKLPRRGPGEAVRLAIVVGPLHEEAEPHSSEIETMVGDAVAQHHGLEVVPEKQWRPVLDKHLSALRQSGIRDSMELERLILEGAPFDSVLNIQVSVKEKFGLVGKNMAAALALVFNGTVGCLFCKDEYDRSQQGASTGSIVGAYKEDGKTKTAELPIPRQIAKDRAAVSKLVASCLADLDSKIRPKLPTISGIAEVRQAYGIGVKAAPRRGKKVSFMEALKSGTKRQPSKLDEKIEEIVAEKMAIWRAEQAAELEEEQAATRATPEKQQSLESDDGGKIAKCDGMREHGTNLRKEGLWEQAEESFVQAYRNCGEPRDLARAARAAEGRGEFDRAYRYAVEFLKRAPENHSLRAKMKKSAVYYQKKDKELDAARSCERLRNKGRYFRKHGQLSDARKQFHLAFEECREADDLIRAARAAQESKDWKAAIGDTTRFLEEAPAAHPQRSAMEQALVDLKRKARSGSPSAPPSP